MAEVFLKLFVWGMHNMKRVSREIDIDTINIELCLGMTNQQMLDASWTNNLS